MNSPAPQAGKRTRGEKIEEKIGGPLQALEGWDGGRKKGKRERRSLAPREKKLEKKSGLPVNLWPHGDDGP